MIKCERCEHYIRITDVDEDYLDMDCDMFSFHILVGGEDCPDFKEKIRKRNDKYE